MEKIDEIKEFIGYLKVIFVLVAATTISLVGWFVQNYRVADSLLVYASLVLIFLLFLGLYAINRKIISDIKKLRGL